MRRVDSPCLKESRVKARLKLAEQRVKGLSSLHKVGSLLISTLDMVTVKRRVITAVTEILDAETCSLFLVDREKKELYFDVALGEGGERIKELRLKIGDGVAGWVAKYGKPIIIDDVTKDKRFEKSFDQHSNFNTRNMLCVPIKIKGRKIAVLQAINKTKGCFTAEDLRLARLLSNQVAIALDNARLYEELSQIFILSVGVLAQAIEKRDRYTGGHTQRELYYCLAIGRHLSLSKEMLERLRRAALLHDIGKIGIDDAVLNKQFRLNENELIQMRRHPSIGAEMLHNVPQLKDVVPGMLHHHERVDGKGYPSGRKGRGIPLVARIIAVADTYDAMTTTRPYRNALSPETAIAELKRCSGKQFDKTVVDAFIKAHDNNELDLIQNRGLASL
ncbi:MAG: HD domain-containing protein [Deltaproteobacteria bacterium]|nr:HD domain-containing protein [Deltaproteobacteria bacterium]